MNTYLVTLFDITWRGRNGAGPGEYAPKDLAYYVVADTTCEAMEEGLRRASDVDGGFYKLLGARIDTVWVA